MSRTKEVSKKKMGIIIAVMAVVLLLLSVIACFILFDKKVTDIKCEANIIEFDIDRQFYLYDDYPLDKEMEVEPLREVEVTLKGTGNCDTGEFDGVINVDGLEMGGNLQSYCIKKLEDIYMIDCLTSNVDYLEPVEFTYYYVLNKGY